MSRINQNNIVFRYEDRLIDYRPQSQFYGWGYVAVTVVLGIVLLAVVL